MKILQVASECFGVAKTGGLADMVSALSASLTALGDDVWVCLPAYRGTTNQLLNATHAGAMDIRGHRFRILTGSIKQTGQKVALLDCPALFDRAGDPYRDERGQEFTDNGWRFGLFNLAVTELIARGLPGWKPDTIHLHDWHTGLIPALLQLRQIRLPTIFTIHNFSFQGIFPRSLFDALGLPNHWWHVDAVEYYQQFSFMKAALVYAARVTAVSPRYAREIHTAEFGCGLEGVVQQYSERISGIINGIDTRDWNPSADPYLEQGYSARNVAGGKTAAKQTLRKELGLPASRAPLFIAVSRLAHQKGMDLLLAAKEEIDQLPLQLAVLGRGEADQEVAFSEWARTCPHRVAAVIDVDERLAHRMIAAADFQLMPSRFEPCGLSQLYAQRYGTLPIARATGGLADTIVDAEERADQGGTGLLFEHAAPEDLLAAMKRALDLYADKRRINRMRRRAMAQDFSWKQSAQTYRRLYQSLLPSARAVMASAI